MRAAMLRLTLVFNVLSFIAGAQEKITINDALFIQKINERVFVHVSKLESPDFGTVWCNGLIYINNNEAVMMDTPPNVKLSDDLLSWFEKQFPGVRVKAIIVNHFHADCLGGLYAFHKRNIPSISHALTPKLLEAKRDTLPLPQRTFESKLDLPVGKTMVELRYFGEAHTRDNIIAWIPDEQTIFGGCLVKALKAGKGNLADANVADWSSTVEKIQLTYPTVKVVVPGHGAIGGADLLEFTKQLFQQ